MQRTRFRLLGKGLFPHGEEDPDTVERRTLEALLRRYSVFADLDPEQLRGLIPAIRHKQFRDEEIVCHCPDATHDAFVLLDGVAAITKNKGGMLHVVQLEREGAVFNLGPLVGFSADKAGARALGTVKLLALNDAMLSQRFERHPGLGYPFVRALLGLALDQCDRQLDHYLE